MGVHLFDSSGDAISALAEHIVQVAAGSIRERGIFTLVLSGGSSPEALYRKLASPGYRPRIAWDRVRFFFGDERYVPAGDSRYNGGMARRTLFDPLHIPEDHIFLIDTSLAPEEAARAYAGRIDAFFGKGDARFDLILLGLGSNVHTASLFPHTDVLDEPMPTVRSVFLPEEKVYRITMTAPLINEAHHVAFLVYGADKAEAVRKALQGDPSPAEYPAQLIHPTDGNLDWFLDGAAGAGLRPA